MTAQLQDRRDAGDARGVAMATGYRGRDITRASDVSGGWPGWAAAQLDRAVRVAAETPRGTGLAAALYRGWFAPPIGSGRPPRRALAGMYRAAHAGSAPGRAAAATLDRHDVIGADGWWRTWGESWTPPRGRPGSVRLLVSVDPAQLGTFVGTVTELLLGERLPWSVAVATDPHRVRRAGAAVVDLPGDEVGDGVLADLLARVAPILVPATSPLCRPLAPGAALAHHPDNGMSFGEHRCHLVAVGLRRAGHRDALASIAEVFTAHGIDPAHPYRSR